MHSVQLKRHTGSLAALGGVQGQVGSLVPPAAAGSAQCAIQSEFEGEGEGKADGGKERELKRLFKKSRVTSTPFFQGSQQGGGPFKSRLH